MKLWVTGGDGLLGSTLKKYAALATGREWDIADLSSLRAFALKNPGITHIVNCAAFSLVDLAEIKRDEAFHANAIGPENLGLLAKEMKAKLIHISTDYVFPGNLHRPLREVDPVGPLSYYGLTKLEGERRLQKVNPESCIIRTSWIFGRGGKNFVAKLFQMLQSEDEIRLTSDAWNRPTFVHDLVKVILQMLDATGLYHFANAGVTTKYEFGLEMQKRAIELGFPLKTKRMIATPAAAFPAHAIRPIYSGLDTSKIEQIIRIRPWQEALSEYLREVHEAP